jgi:hypothetical protein
VASFKFLVTIGRYPRNTLIILDIRRELLNNGREELLTEQLLITLCTL